MKGRMDVLNRRKRTSAENTPRMVQSESKCGDVIKIESNDEFDKENCRNEDYITDLTLNDSRDDESMSNDDEGSENIKDEVFATEIMEDDDYEVENPDLSVFSVAVKEQSRSGRDCPRENEPVRSRVEIKYEDDIEEEEYDSDDESVDRYEMNDVNDMNDEGKPINFVKVGDGVASNTSPASVPYRSCFNTECFDSNMSNFQLSDRTERNDLLESGINIDMRNRNDKSSDSILLSIVYATINVPFSQVSKFLTAYNLSKGQLSVIRKVRRQVKNRLYAQNCRKRRVAHIKNLANELQQIKVEKEKLCSVRDDLRMKKIDMEARYNQLYAYVINALAKKHSEEFDFSDSDSNINDSSEETKLLKRKLAEEYDELETKKLKMEQKYEELYQNIFRVIKSRHQNNGLARNGMDCNIDFQLCHMDIVNELAMLNKYWTKNNLHKSNEQMDFESSISVDGSRTSENELNDFVNYESSASIDSSRCNESKLNDFVDYESSVDYCIQQNIVAHYQNDEKGSESNEVVVLNVDDDDDEDDAPNDEDQHDDNRKKFPKPDSSSQDDRNEDKSKICEESLIIWSEEEDNAIDEDNDDDDLDQDIKEYVVELCKQKEILENEKTTILDRYEALYEHVFKAMNISETEFLKNLLDYCIGLLRPFAVQSSVPKSDPGGSTITLEGS